MVTIKPKNLEEFIEIFGNYTNSGINYYRGQSNEKWDIIPGIARNKKIFNQVLAIEAKLILKFEKKISDYGLLNLIPIDISSHHNSWIILMAAQHYGLPTRLLDFSFNKFVALEFALLDMGQINKHSALIIYKNANQYQNTNSTLVENKLGVLKDSFFINTPIIKTLTENEIKMSETRKFIQNSKFFYRGSEKLFCCLSLDYEHSHNLEKNIISKSLKPFIIDYLDKRNELLFDSYKAKNGVDYIAGVLNNEYNNIVENDIDNYLKF